MISAGCECSNHCRKKLPYPLSRVMYFIFYYYFFFCTVTTFLSRMNPKKAFYCLNNNSRNRLTFECKKLGAVLKMVSIYSWTIWNIILVWKDMYNLSILYEIQSAFQVSTICITLVINSAILWKELMGFKENRSNWMFKYSLFKMIILVLLAAIG